MEINCHKKAHENQMKITFIIPEGIMIIKETSKYRRKLIHYSNREGKKQNKNIPHLFTYIQTDRLGERQRKT